jgi:signal transduction histidine kinase
MGLALVKKAIQDNGGVVEVISAPDERPGTTFRFTWAKVDGSPE